MLEKIRWGDDMKKMNARAETTIQQMHLPTPTRDEQTRPQSPQAPVLSQKTPQEYYAEITKRPDVRKVLEELAAG